MKKIYISGAISGIDPSEVRRRFMNATRLIERQGYIAVNPARISSWQLEWSDYMAIAEYVIEKCNIEAIYMLEGWRESRGARMEHEWAEIKKIKIIYEDPIDRIIGGVKHGGTNE